MVFLSGQIPVNPATGEVVEGGITEQTTQVFENIKNVLAEAGLTTANVVKPLYSWQIWHCSVK